MKGILSVFAMLAISVSVMAAEPEEMRPLPEFPVDKSGMIVFEGSGESGCTPETLVTQLNAWAEANAEEFIINEVTTVGTADMAGTFVLVDDQGEDGSRILELLEYHVAVMCDADSYSYRIDSIDMYVVVMMPVGTGQGYVDNEGVSYAVVDMVKMGMPDDYVSLVRESFNERQRLRVELDELMATDISKMHGNRLRKYNDKLQTVSDRYVEVDDYYDVVRSNYEKCYVYLTELNASLSYMLSKHE